MEKKHLPVALFNGTVATTNGLYSIEDISVSEARALIKKYGFVSALGHEATAIIMARLLEEPITMNRIQFTQQVGQMAIAFKLNQRPDEGIILNQKEIEEIGFSLKLMKRLS
ncbi:YddF family protein [Alkaliphilus crotonatoxidans]